MTFHPATRTSGRSLWLAWVVILVGVAGVTVATALSTGNDGGPARLVAELQLRAATGMREIGIPGALGQVEATLALGTPHERAAAVVAAAEARGPQAARERVVGLESAISASGDTPERTADLLLAAEVLARLYADDDVAARADALAPSSRERLTESLGWIGELALHPAGTANTAARASLLRAATRTAIANFAVLVLGGLGVLLGAVVIVLALVQLRLGELSAGYRAEDGPAGAFAETFALWLALFFAMTSVVPLVLGKAVGPGMLAGVAVAQVVSLAALAWPGRRGIAWPAVRARLGLNTGRGLLREIGAGVVAYVGMLPLVLVGVLLSYVLQRLGAPVAGHPAAEMLGGGPGVVAAVLVVGALFAPIVEEVAFRGLLYHHLRSATRRRGPALSVALSALVSGVLFAAIHPQGLAGIPFLGAIGAGLALTREWRGSIVAPIVTHACVNSVTFTLLILAT